MIQLQKTQGETQWFLHDRLGLFIHWGLYALGARHEWLKSREKMTTVEYQKYFDHFDPDLFDPQSWAKSAKAAGNRRRISHGRSASWFLLLAA